MTFVQLASLFTLISCFVLAGGMFAAHLIFNRNVGVKGESNPTSVYSLSLKFCDPMRFSVIALAALMAVLSYTTLVYTLIDYNPPLTVISTQESINHAITENDVILDITGYTNEKKVVRANTDLSLLNDSSLSSALLRVRRNGEPFLIRLTDQESIKEFLSSVTVEPTPVTFSQKVQLGFSAGIAGLKEGAKIGDGPAFQTFPKQGKEGVSTAKALLILFSITLCLLTPPLLLVFYITANVIFLATLSWKAISKWHERVKGSPLPAPSRITLCACLLLLGFIGVARNSPPTEEFKCNPCKGLPVVTVSNRDLQGDLIKVNPFNELIQEQL